MTIFRNIDTNEIFTLEEIMDGYELYKDEIKEKTFEEYFDKLLEMGRAGVGGFVEVYKPETIKDILNKYHLNRVQLSKRFGIPYRTVQGWTDEKTANARNCPAYIVNMIDEILKHDSEQ